MKTFDEFIAKKKIKYAMAQPTTVYSPTGKPMHLKRGEAMAKRSSSSGSGCGS
jgi:hypothetical protein